MNHSKPFKLAILPVMISALSGCGDDNLDPEAVNAPSRYQFMSAINDNVSSVDYATPATLLTLVSELESFIYSNTIQDIGLSEGKDEVYDRLNTLFANGTDTNQTPNLTSYDIQSGTAIATPFIAENLDESLSLSQSDFSELANGVTIKGYLPGTYKDLELRNETDSTGELGVFIGWSIANLFDHDETPKKLIENCFTGISLFMSDDDSSTTTINMDTGVDFAELSLTYLKTVIPYYYITEVTLNDTELASQLSLTAAMHDSNTYLVEHYWDEAFGAFGANYAFKENRSTQAYSDVNNNLAINLINEANHHLAISSVERDKNPLAETNFTNEIMTGFLEGRQLISTALHDNEPMPIAEIQVRANTIKGELERVIAANAIHYINEVKDAARYFLLGDAYKRTYFSAWSRLKGTLLALQPGTNSSLTREQLEDIHDLVGASPELSDSFMGNYLEGLDEVSSLLASELNFSATATASW